MQNFLTFPKGLLGFCNFLTLPLAVFTYNLSVTDISLEPEKESSSRDSLLFISENCGSRRDHIPMLVNKDDLVESTQGVWFGYVS